MTPARPRVAFVLADLLDDWLAQIGSDLETFCGSWTGGWLMSYVRVLREAGVDPVIIATARVPATLRRIHAPSGVPIWVVPPASTGRRALTTLARLPLPGGVVARLRHLADDRLMTPTGEIERIAREEQCAALFVQDYETARFSACLGIGERLGVPVFGTFTGTVPPPRWQAPRRGVAMRRAAGFVVCAQSEIERIRGTYGVARERILKLYYPLDPTVWYPEDRRATRAALGLDPDAVIAIFHGMIHFEVKGLDILLAAWDRAEVPGPRQLLLVGEGPDADRLEQVLRARGRADVVFLRGWQQDPAKIRRHLSAADLYVFPSRIDSFGIGVTEAMMCGLPVVATEGRGTRDILPEGEGSGGILVPNDDVAAFTAALGRVMHDAALRDRLAAAARRRAAAPDLGAGIGPALAAFLTGRR